VQIRREPKVDRIDEADVCQREKGECGNGHPGRKYDESLKHPGMLPDRITF